MPEDKKPQKPQPQRPDPKKPAFRSDQLSHGKGGHKPPQKPERPSGK